jgi:quercetin dioxygenase-like cupin family protein
MSKDTEFLNDFDDSDEIELNRLLEGLAPIVPEAVQAANLRTSIMQRVSQSIAEHAGLLTVRSKHGVWKTLKSGIRYKSLCSGSAGSSVLIEFAPGASLPAHRHNWMEEGIVLQGDLCVGELRLGPLDYHMSPKGSRHSSIRSRQGALAFLCGSSVGHRASVMQELIGGLLPIGKDHCITVFASEKDHWQEIAAGVFKKDLWSDQTRVSRLCRFEAGAKVPGHTHLLDEECMMLEGELFLGDILLRAGEYQLAPAGSKHAEVYSDVGATVFVRAARGDY